MSHALPLNIVGVLCAVALGFFSGPTRDFGNFGRVWAAWAAFCVTTGLSVAAWTIYVAAHFVGRYW